MCDLCDRVPGWVSLTLEGGVWCGQLDFRGRQHLHCSMVCSALLDSSYLTAHNPQSRQKQVSFLEKQWRNGGPVWADRPLRTGRT